MPVAEQLGIDLPPGYDVAGHLRLPCQLANDRVVFGFAADAALGVVLSGIEHREGPGHGTAITAAADHPRDAGLWQLTASLPVLSEPVAITAADADPAALEVFRVASAASPSESALLLVWRGITARVPLDSGPLPPAIRRRQTGLFVAQLVTLRPNQSFARWTTWVGREHPHTGIGLEAIDSPSIHLRGPVAPRPNETHLAAQRRTRLLIPTSATFVAGMGSIARSSLLNGVNWPLYYWSAFAVKNVLPHPNHQQQQFQAVYAADSRDEESFRRLLYFATEDSTGHLKNFHHEGYTVEGRDGPEGWYNWRAQYVPGYEDALSPLAQKPRTRFGNTYVTPYPAVVGPLLAQTDEFWFDVAAVYRDWVSQSGMWPHRTIDDPDRGALAHYAPLVGCIDPRNLERNTGKPLHDDFLQAIRTIRKGLDPHGQRTPRVFAHSQNLRKDGIHVQIPDDPISDHIDPWMAILARQADGEGISTSFYVRPHDLRLDVTPTWAASVPPEARGYDRDGSPSGGIIFTPEQFATGVEPDGPILDYGSPVAQTWFLDQVYRPLMEGHGMRGAYMDVFAGHGASPFYDPPPPLQPTHVAHGGDYYMQGKRAAVTAIRKFMQDLAAKRGEDPAHYFIAGEGAEEFLADKYDWVNAGYGYFGDHLMFAEDVVLRWLAEYTNDPDPDGAFDGVPAVSRNMSPPLWNMVHHEWAPGQRAPVPFSDIGLETNYRFYPRPHPADNPPTNPVPPYTGIALDKWVDLYCYTQALRVSEGVHPNQFVYYRHVDDEHRDLRNGAWVLDAAGNAAIESSIDPRGAGLKALRFYELLHRGMTDGPLREFVLYGRIERGLDVDYEGGDIALVTNPMFWLFGQESPFEFFPPYDQSGQILPGRSVEPLHDKNHLPTDLLAICPYPTSAFNNPYLPAFLRCNTPRVLHSTWRAPTGHLGVLLTNWSGEATKVTGTLQLGSLGLDPHVGCHVRVESASGPMTPWLRATGDLLRLSSHQAGADVHSIPAVPPRSFLVIRLIDHRLPFIYS